MIMCYKIPCNKILSLVLGPAAPTPWTKSLSPTLVSLPSAMDGFSPGIQVLLASRYGWSAFPCSREYTKEWSAWLLSHTRYNGLGCLQLRTTYKTEERGSWEGTCSKGKDRLKLQTLHLHQGLTDKKKSWNSQIQIGVCVLWTRARWAKWYSYFSISIASLWCSSSEVKCRGALSSLHKSCERGFWLCHFRFTIIWHGTSPE